MPRKNYTPKNPYVHNSNLSLEAFLTLTQGFISGMSAADIHRAMKEAHEKTGEIPLPPSTKTIAKLYRRLGHYLFERLAEPRLPPIPEMKELFPDQYSEHLDKMARILTEFSLSGMSYENWRALHEDSAIFAFGDHYSDEIRSIYAARKGQRSDPRAVLGLATHRVMVRRNYEGKVSSEQMILIMQEILLSFLEDEPLRMS